MAGISLDRAVLISMVTEAMLYGNASDAYDALRKSDDPQAYSVLCLASLSGSSSTSALAWSTIVS